MHIWLKRLALTVLAAGFVAAMTAGPSFAANGFAGSWAVQDSSGHQFEITLSANGKAKANRAGEGMSGEWKQVGSAAVISWNTGWTTKIVKKTMGYEKQAWAKGKPVSGAPTSTSKAQRAK